jgi:nucleoid-associated protein YgaU
LPAPETTKEKPVPTAVTAEEKPRPVAKQTPASTDRPTATAVTAKVSRPAAQEYTVKAGDTLSKLAERFYNSMSKWDKIYEANKDTLRNPNYIYIGQKLIIPSDDQAS